MDANNKSTCSLCNVEQRKYTCPRCGIAYCGVDCYKSQTHSDCSESFYKQCVEDELKTQESDPEARQSMIDILRRINEEELVDDNFEDDINDTLSDIDSDDEENVAHLEQRLANVNLDNADDVWQVLTDTEKQEFITLVNSGEVEKILLPWTPWWTYHKPKKLIHDFGEDIKDFDYKKECPTLIDIPYLKELSKAAENVRYNLINLIYAYTYMALHFNGDYLNCAKEAAGIVFHLSDNMRENRVFDDASTAKESIVCRVKLCNSLPQDEKVLSDLESAFTTIIKGPEEENKSFYISVALSELHRLLSTARMQKTNSVTSQNRFSEKFLQGINITLSKQSLTLSLKKLEYYLSWVNNHFY